MPATRQWEIQNSLNVSDASTLFLSNFTWFELSRVKLYRNDVRGNESNFELAGGSSCRGFELPRVKLR